MPVPLPSFDLAAEAANRNPQAYYAYRSDLINRTIAGSRVKTGLSHLQAEIDQQRATQISPMHNLSGMMEMLDGKLSTLTELLAHWQTVLDLELPEGVPEAQIPLEKINHMLASIIEMRARVAETTLR